VSEDISLNGRLFVSGNVGIGSGSPIYKLDVVSDANKAPLNVKVGSTNALSVNGSGAAGIGTISAEGGRGLTIQNSNNNYTNLGYNGLPSGTKGMWINYVGTGIIHLFRREEILKVLCHELSHEYKLDCYNLDNYKDNVLKDFNIVMEKNSSSIVEAYCEYFACIHHIAIISLYTNVSPYLIYHYEKIWCLYQVCKILKHYNMEKFEDLYENKFIQETNVFSYYIIKFFLLWKLDNKCNYKNLKEILKDSKIIKIINENMYHSFDKNLRMTLFELQI
jgi:hypothetical protein